LPNLPALIGGAAADALLDRVEPGDATQGLGGDRRAAVGQVVEAPMRMGLIWISR
jgi:hypothetical protein